jgi:hypothetical protein
MQQIAQPMMLMKKRLPKSASMATLIRTSSTSISGLRGGTT